MKKIEISKNPTKMKYIQNLEELDLTGGKIKISYNDKGLKIDESFYGTNEEPILITDTYDFFNTNKF